MKRKPYAWKSIYSSIEIPVPDNRCGDTMHSKAFKGRRYRRGRNRCVACGGYWSNIDLLIRAQKESEEDMRKKADEIILGRRSA